MNKITCICLGVKDMERSIKFYRDGLGYKTDCTENSYLMKWSRPNMMDYDKYTLLLR